MTQSGTPPLTDRTRARETGIPRWRPWLVTEGKIRAFRGYAADAVITSFGNPLVYLLALGVGLGTLVPQGIDGVNYIVFVAPALLAMAAVYVAMDEASYPVLVGFKYRPVFVAMHQTSLRPRDIYLGLILFIALRMVATVVVYLLVIYLFGGVVLATSPLAIGVATLTGLAVAAPVSAYAATIRDDRGQLPMLFRLGFMPLFLFSGTFFPLETLPGALQVVGWISPLWHGAQWGRVLTYGFVEPWWLTLIHFVYLLVWILAGLWAGLRVFRTRLEGS